MNLETLKQVWKEEEAQAKIHGWDFSHIAKRYKEEGPLLWNYKGYILDHLKDIDELLDIDTGGGEFLLSLNHPFEHTSATEGYGPNVELCKKELLQRGICFKEMRDYSKMPFEDNHFDMIINRHGEYDISEIHRVLKKGGLFITEQVGEDNERELVELLLPGTPKPFCHLNLKDQKRLFEEAEFKIIEAEEQFRPIRFFDVGALVWFAHIIEWEFPNFSVDHCFEPLLQAKKMIDTDGFVEGHAHRYFIVARK